MTIGQDVKLRFSGGIAMNNKSFSRLCIVLSLIFCFPVMAQLNDRFEVVSTRNIGKPTRLTPAIDRKDQNENPELLLSLGKYHEAADAYGNQIDRFHAESNQQGLDMACSGLIRALYLSHAIDSDPNRVALCRNEITDPLLSRADREPMFITYPAFDPPVGWLKTAEPGFPYKVSVEFDIDESGKAHNFVFDAKESYYLKFPVIDALKNSRYLPAMQDGKPVKRSKNVVEVTFCLDRGVNCGDG
jgi:hypothetical protein